MVGRPSRGGAAVGAARDDLEISGNHDSVEHRDRPARMKTSPAWREMMVGAEITKAAAVHAPFVEIAHQHRRDLAFAIDQMVQDGMSLAPPPKARQIEMHADDPERRSVHLDVGEHRSAWLERGEVEEVALQDFYRLSHQQSVAVPANASGAGVERHRPIVAMFFEQRNRDRAGPRPEAPIGLLKGDDVGAELVQDVDRPFRTAPPIGADRLADIVAGDADHCGSRLKSRSDPRKRSFNSVGSFVVEPPKGMVERLGRFVRCGRDGILYALGVGMDGERLVPRRSHFEAHSLVVSSLGAVGIGDVQFDMGQPPFESLQLGANPLFKSLIGFGVRLDLVVGVDLDEHAASTLDARR